MTTPTIPYSFTCGTTGLNTQVNSNFSAIFDAVSDGTRSLRIGTIQVTSSTVINDALVASSSAILNGNVVFADNAADVVTLNASLVPASAACHTMGSASKAWSKAYINGTFNGTFTQSGNTASFTSNQSAETGCLYGMMTCKAWALIGSQGTYITGVNVSLASRTATGQYTIWFNRAMANTSFVGLATVVASNTSGSWVQAQNWSVSAITYGVGAVSSTADKITCWAVFGSQ